MKTKLAKTVNVGDRVALEDWTGPFAGTVTKIERFPLVQHAEGPCYEISWQEDRRGKKGRQLVGGNQEIQLAQAKNT